jgi:hypothetical protein
MWSPLNSGSRLHSPKARSSLPVPAFLLALPRDPHHTDHACHVGYRCGSSMRNPRRAAAASSARGAPPAPVSLDTLEEGPGTLKGAGALDLALYVSADRHTQLEFASGADGFEFPRTCPTASPDSTHVGVVRCERQQAARLVHCEIARLRGRCGVRDRKRWRGACM